MDSVIASASFSLGTGSQVQTCVVRKSDADDKLSVTLQSLKGQCSALMSAYLAIYAGGNEPQDEPMAWEGGSDDEEEIPMKASLQNKKRRAPQQRRK